MSVAIIGDYNVYISPLSVSASDRSRSTTGLGTKCYCNLGMTNDDS